MLAVDGTETKTPGSKSPSVDALEVFDEVCRDQSLNEIQNSLVVIADAIDSTHDQNDEEKQPMTDGIDASNDVPAPVKTTPTVTENSTVCRTPYYVVHTVIK